VKNTYNHYAIVEISHDHWILLTRIPGAILLFESRAPAPILDAAY